MIVYCADIGSVARRRFGWCRVPQTDPAGISHSDSIEDLVAAVSSDLNAGAAVALGFECPLFIARPSAATKG